LLLFSFYLADAAFENGMVITVYGLSGMDLLVFLELSDFGRF